MNAKARQLFREEMGEIEPDLVIRTKARVDAGRWWRRTPLWFCVAGQDLVMLAVARRRYFAQVPIAESRESFYNHTTGEFVIVPGEELGFRTFSLRPRDALKVLEYLKSSTHTPANS
ncbi:MAG: hypothetical protein PVJ98_02235 [Akkermansiaceae bacterium]|jgi:hypothetical protein